ncbi:hypothetical protein [Parasynechococcus marenigrum]|uniref:hypothetical protein n=1 Tax=Parasynechococcus marenigrum TaxID=2881428 RepID=UPI0011D2140A|nr:hypothetical protein [Parasynechococcus marenigrum]
MYNQPSRHTGKLKKAASNPFIGSASGGSSQEINTDANGMISASNPRQTPFSPASERTFDMSQSKGMNQAQQSRAAVSMQTRHQQQTDRYIPKLFRHAGSMRMKQHF